jgi:hypothetical protein
MSNIIFKNKYINNPIYIRYVTSILINQKTKTKNYM